MRNILFLTVALAFMLAGCGGGGGGSSAPAGRIVSGVASKGLIRNGTVRIHALNPDGTKGTILATAATDGNGRYLANVGNYTGAVLVEAFGNYTDEATGQTKTITATSPLRAAFHNVTSNVTVAVTPLTDIAVRKAGALTPTSIQAANTLVSDLFKIPDIVAVAPVDATSSALQDPGTTSAQRDYTLALATISQMALNQNAAEVTNVIEGISNNISNGTMTQQAATQFATALNAYAAANPSVVTTLPLNLTQVGKRTVLVRLGITQSQRIYGVSATVVLPAGVSIKVADQATGRVDPAVIAASGNITNGALVEGKYTPPLNGSPGRIGIGVIVAEGFSAGEFVVVRCDVDAGVTVSQADFSVGPSPTFVDAGGTLSGAVLSLTATML